MRRSVGFVTAALVALALGACSKPDAQAQAAKASAAAAEAAKTKPVATTGRRIDVIVTKNGYAPDKIDVAANEDVTLVFTRTEDTECGAEVMIPSMNVKKPLPLNEPVAIAFKADKPGEVGFACGMDMMKGTLVVR